MKKLYTLLAAIVVSLTAVAQTSVKDFEGEWTFMVADMNNGGAAQRLIVDMEYEYGECYFYLPDGRGCFYASYSELNTNNSTITFRFQVWSYQSLKAGNYYQDEYSYYVNNGSSNNATVWAVYDIESESFTRFYYKIGTTIEKEATNIGFHAELFDQNPFNTGEDEEPIQPVDSWNYMLLSGQYGVDPNAPSLYVGLGAENYSISYDTKTTAQLVATPSITAENVSSYKVFYNLYYDSTPVVEDTEIVPVDGEYKIQVGGLRFESNYTLSVWATSDEMNSPVVKQNFYTGDAPSLTVSSAEATEITGGSAVLAVTLYTVNMPEGLTYTVSATTEDGPTVENVETQSTSVTLNLSGLTGNTDYTYTVTATSTDEKGITFSGSKDVTFTTPAPSVDVEGISYSPIPQGAKFTVESLVADGVGEDENVGVYFSLEESDALPAKAELVGGKYVYSFTNLEAETEYTAIIFAGLGELGTDGFVKGPEHTQEFTTGEEGPYIEVSLPDGSYTSEVQNRYLAKIVATPTVKSENVESFDVYYTLYQGNAAYREGAIEAVDGEYTLTIEDLPFSRTYRLDVWAVADGYVSEVASVEVTTLDEPSIKINFLEVQNITETSAEIVVEYEAVSLVGVTKFIVSATPITAGAPTVGSVTTTENRVTLELSGLTPGTMYTYNVKINCGDEDKSMYQADKAVIFGTLSPRISVTLGDISYTQIPGGAYFIVKDVEAEGLLAGEEVDVYFVISGSGDTPQKGAKVTNGGETYYEYTFENLASFTPYTAIIFGGVGEYGSDSFVKSAEYKANFVSGELGIEAIEVEGANRVRYFNLQGVEVQNPGAGLYIRVNGGKVDKIRL